MKRMIVAVTLTAVCGIVRAEAPAASPAAPGQEQIESSKNKAGMRADEPMKIPMAREGTMKGDVKQGAARKDAALKEKMKQEEMTMPAAPK